MNLVKQFREFGVLNSINPLPMQVQVLYYNLMQAFNIAGWPDRLTVQTQALENRCGMTRKQLATARNVLIQRGLIKYYPARQASGSPAYELAQLYDEAKGANPYSPVFPLETHRGTQEGTHRGTQNGTQNGQRREHLYKQNKTEQNSIGANPDLPSPPPQPSRNELRKKRIEAFMPPTLDQAKNFFREKTKNVWPAAVSDQEAEDYFNHYEANGWVQNKGKPIVKWEAAACKWINNAKRGEFSKAGHGRELKPPAAEKSADQLKSDIETFYQSFLSGDERLKGFQPEHYELLKSEGLAKLPQDLIEKIKSDAVVLRMSYLLGGNLQKDKDLYQAYEKGHPAELLEHDRPKLTMIQRRLAVIAIFKTKQKNGKTKFFEP